jgi:hypothetical protein
VALRFYFNFTYQRTAGRASEKVEKYVSERMANTVMRRLDLPCVEMTYVTVWVYVRKEAAALLCVTGGCSMDYESTISYVY